MTPHKSQMSGILHAKVHRFVKVDARKAPSHGDSKNQTAAKGNAVRQNAASWIIPCSALPAKTKIPKTAKSPKAGDQNERREFLRCCRLDLHRWILSSTVAGKERIVQAAFDTLLTPSGVLKKHLLR